MNGLGVSIGCPPDYIVDVGGLLGARFGARRHDITRSPRRGRQRRRYRNVAFCCLSLSLSLVLVECYVPVACITTRLSDSPLTHLTLMDSCCTLNPHDL